MSTPDDARPGGDPADDALLAELGDVLQERAQDAPAEVVEAAKGLLTWRTVDAELARLAFDSLVDGAAVTRAGVVDAGPRLLTFEADAATLEVEVGRTAAGVRLVGQLDPPGPAAVAVRGPASVVTGAADELGRFVLEVPAPAGPVTVSWTPAGGPTYSGSAVLL